MNIRVPVPEKPEALILTQQMKELNRPLWDGGIMDQPHIFMMEYRLCSNTMELHEALRRRNEAAEANNA